MLVQKTKVKALIVKHGLQSTDDAIEIIDRKVVEFLEANILEAKSQGAKRLMSDVAKYFVKSTKQIIEKSTKSCQRCVNIQETYIKWARQIQGFCHDEATINLNKLLRKK